MAKTVIVSCGTAIATSTVAAKAIEEACKAAGIDVITKQCKAAEIPVYPFHRGVTVSHRTLRHEVVDVIGPVLDRRVATTGSFIDNDFDDGGV